MYASSDDMVTAFGMDELIQLTDPNAEVLDEAVLARALRSASAEADGYLAVRFTLPLPSVPDVLVNYCCDIALYRLMTLRRKSDVEEARIRYEDALRFLREVARGKASLGGLEPETRGGGQVVFGSDGRAFGRSEAW